MINRVKTKISSVIQSQYKFFSDIYSRPNHYTFCEAILGESRIILELEVKYNVAIIIVKFRHSHIMCVIVAALV